MHLKNLFENTPPVDKSQEVIQILEAEKANWSVRVIFDDIANIEDVLWGKLADFLAERRGIVANLLFIEMSLHSADMSEEGQSKLVRIFTNQKDALKPGGFHDEDEFYDYRAPNIAFEFSASSRPRIQQTPYGEPIAPSRTGEIETRFEFINYDDYGAFSDHEYPGVKPYLANLCREAIRTVNDSLKRS